jgi:hypothetical protein
MVPQSSVRFLFVRLWILFGCVSTDMSIAGEARAQDARATGVRSYSSSRWPQGDPPISRGVSDQGGASPASKFFERLLTGELENVKVDRRASRFWCRVRRADRSQDAEIPIERQFCPVSFRRRWTRLGAASRFAIFAARQQ